MKHTLFKSHKKAFTIVFLILLVMINSSAIQPLWGEFLTSIGGNLTNAGIAVAIVNVGTATFTALLAFVESKNSKNSSLFIVLGLLLLSISYFIYIFVSNVIELYFVLLLISLANGMMWPAFSTLYQTTFNAKNGAACWAMYNLSEDMGAGVGAFLGAHTVSAVGFSILFLSLSIISFLSFLVALMLLHQAKSRKTPRKRLRRKITAAS